VGRVARVRGDGHAVVGFYVLGGLHRWGFVGWVHVHLQDDDIC
jgi:hypothetical protein